MDVLLVEGNAVSPLNDRRLLSAHTRSSSVSPQGVSGRKKGQLVCVNGSSIGLNDIRYGCGWDMASVAVFSYPVSYLPLTQLGACACPLPMLRPHGMLAFRHLAPCNKHSTLIFRPLLSCAPSSSRRGFLPSQLRLHQHLANAQSIPQAPSDTTKKQETNTQKASSANSKPAVAGPQDLGGDTVHKSQAEQRKADWRIVKNLIRHLWPRDEWSVKARLIVALSLLVGGKVSRYSGRRYGTLTLVNTNSSSLMYKSLLYSSK